MEIFASQKRITGIVGNGSGTTVADDFRGAMESNRSRTVHKFTKVYTPHLRVNDRALYLVHEGRAHVSKGPNVGQL